MHVLQTVQFFDGRYTLVRQQAVFIFTFILSMPFVAFWWWLRSLFLLLCPVAPPTEILLV